MAGKPAPCLVFDPAFLPRSPISQIYAVVLGLQAVSFLRQTQPSKLFAFSSLLTSCFSSSVGVMSQPFLPERGLTVLGVLHWSQLAY